MQKKIDVTAIGELLADFTAQNNETNNGVTFCQNPGGAPCNVLCMLAKLEYKTAFIGKVGNDMFGVSLKNAVNNMGIDVSGVCLDNTANTALAFIKNNKDGEREFCFYRSPGADEMLQKKQIPLATVRNTKILHFGSLSLTGKLSRKATYFAVKQAKKHGAIISFDANLRKNLWQKEKTAKKQIKKACKASSVLKLSQNELYFLTNIQNPERGAAFMLKKYKNLRLLFVTCGAQGSYAFYGGQVIYVPAFTNVNVVDTTGAGDTFFACCLHGILKAGAAGLKKENVAEILRFANAAAALCTTKQGAMPAMPTQNEITQFLQSNQGAY